MESYFLILTKIDTYDTIIVMTFCRGFILFLVVLLFSQIGRSSSNLGLELMTDYVYYFEELKEPTRQSDEVLGIEFFGAQKFDNNEFRLKLNVRSNLQSKVNDEQFFLNPKELYWKYRTYPFQILIGYNTYNWGIFDLFSPADLTNPKSFLDLLNSQKIGSPAIDIIYEQMNWSFQFLFFPRQSEIILPAEDSRWLPREILLDTSTDNLRLKLPDSFSYIYDGSEQFSRPFDNNYGARFTMRLDRSDIGISFFEGLAPTPNFLISVSGTLSPDEADTILIDSDVKLKALYYKQRNSSVQLTQLLGPIIFRLESVYSDTLESAMGLPAWSLQNAFGLEYSFRFLEKQLNLILNYYFGDSNEIPDNLVSGSGNFFQNSLGYGLRLSLTSQSSLSLGGLYSLEDNSFYLRLMSESKLNKYISFLASFETIQGDQESFLGSLSKNDRVRGQVKIYF